MFSPFFYILKAKGLDVSLTEWLTLMDALDKGLCESNINKFYYVARMILVKSEADYDKFDVAFDFYNVLVVIKLGSISILKVIVSIKNSLTLV